jgi:membrane carboxypeptidase/penicillin-binding protein PbpC
LRTALQGSLNIPAVKMLYLLGVGNVIDFAEGLGYTTFGDRSRFGLSLVLGGGEVTLLEHTAAYATLAADGMYHEPMALLEVKTNDGHVLDEFTPTETRAIESNIARITSNVLSDNEARAYAFGLNSGLTLPGRPAAAKTGTTNDYRDAWTMGYVPQLATGVWVGNNDFSEMKRGGGSSLAAPIWQGYMIKALQGVPVEQFAQANIPVPDKPILSGKGFGVQMVAIDRASGKLATDLTPASFREERLYVDAHDILYYVDKRNPTGPAPSDPAATDSQFNTWENAAQAWMASRLEKGENIFEFAKDITFPEGLEIVYGLAPTEMDDVHVEVNKPTISIDSPFNDTRLDSRTLQAAVQTYAPRGVGRVEFYFDGILLATDASAPFETQTSLKSFPNGFYTLRAIAYDDVDNSAEASVRVQLQSEESFVDVSWETPESNVQIAHDDTTVPLRLQINATDTINQVTFFALHVPTNEEVLVEAIVSPLSNRVRSTWAPTKPGKYRLYARVSVNGAGVLTGPSLNVEVMPEPMIGEAWTSQ